jgi:hypothetical protein
MGELYTFTIFEDKEAFIEEERTDEASGEKFTAKKKVVSKSPTQVLIKKPTRRQIEEADLEFSIEMSKCIKKGILTKAMLAKKYQDSGGLMSEEDSNRLSDLYKKVYDTQQEITRLESVLNKNEQTDAKVKDLVVELANSRKEIVEIESNFRSLFDHTADSKAQSRLLLWYILNLSFIQAEGEEHPTPYFKGNDFDEKLKSYYAKEEEDSEQYKILSKKLSTFIAFWFYNQALTKEDFDALDKRLESGEL